MRVMFEADPLTEAIVIFGEIGSSQEEELAQLIRDRKVTKPVIAYIGGKAAREGTRSVTPGPSSKATRHPRGKSESFA